MTNPSDERKLVAQAQSGSREALDRLLDAYETPVFNLARRMVGPQDAEDVAQDALVEICCSIGGFRGRSTLSTWVYRVAVNVCLQHLRGRGPEMSPIEDDFAERVPDADPGPAEAAIRNCTKSEVEAAVRALPEVHRDVVVLHELQGLTYAECAEVLGCPVGTVKSRLSNAFAKLREMLRETVSEGEAAI